MKAKLLITHGEFRIYHLIFFIIEEGDDSGPKACNKLHTNRYSECVGVGAKFWQITGMVEENVTVATPFFPHPHNNTPPPPLTNTQALRQPLYVGVGAIVLVDDRKRDKRICL